MQFRFTPAQDAFRQQVREFLRTELPADRPPAVDAEGYEGARQFSKKLAARGWIGLPWPKEHGGQGLGVMEQTIFNEEMITHDAPTGYHFVAERQMGPSIIRQGTEEQKQYFIPRILSADVSFAIGMSEPAAGSDLANVQTRAVIDGDDYVVNGQKIWTSNAHRADWLWLVCRTDPNAPKHRGISVLLMDLKSPGISVRPLVNLAGRHGFNEVFFDNVRVPRKNLVGEENRGWYITAENLDFERSGIDRLAATGRLYRDIVEYVRSRSDVTGTQADIARTELAERAIEYEIGRIIAYRVSWLTSQGRIPNYEASMSKVYGAEWSQRIARTGMKIVTAFAMHRTPEERALKGKIELAYLVTSADTVRGGTSEIQRNIIATRGLGLPRS